MMNPLASSNPLAQGYNLSKIILWVVEEKSKEYEKIMKKQEMSTDLERATTYSNWFEEILPGANVLLYDGSEPLYLDLQNGRVDLIMTNPMKAHLKFLSKENGAGFEFKSPVVDEEKYFGIGVGIGMRKGQGQLKASLNAALKELINSGELETYARKIFPFKLHKDEWGL